MNEALYEALENVQKKANVELERKGYITTNEVHSYLMDELGLNPEQCLMVSGELYGFNKKIEV